MLTSMIVQSVLCALPGVPEPSVVPRPVSLQEGGGEFLLSDETVIVCESGEAEATAEYLRSVLRSATGYSLPLSDSPGRTTILLSIREGEESLGSEGYRLHVDPKEVKITAQRAAGLFYGVQTLRQLLLLEVFSATPVADVEWTVPSVSIEDYPRFAWRGMLLDVARHFMPKEFVKEFIDTLALHKMNRLQLHLTDDQGWRVEIKRYPKLTEVGAWRAETVVGHVNTKPMKFDGQRHGGFYTQDDIRELVAYAAERHVTLVPEIEMPGHGQAAIAAYPELGNTDEPLSVWTRWGVNENIYNPSEHTIQFLQGVLEEVVELFPSLYIHVGGDEAVKPQWKASEAVQARIEELGLNNEDELQRYFIMRMNEFLREKGRRLVGWDEILEAGLSKEATVMAWRNHDHGVAAAKADHDVIMALTSHTYFDYYQADSDTEPLAIGGLLPLAQVYAFDPLPGDLTDEEQAHILGTQGQLWTEYIKTPEHAEYMAFPRTCALAEVAWTPQAARKYDDFRERLEVHLNRLERLGVGFRKLDQ